MWSVVIIIQSQEPLVLIPYYILKFIDAIHGTQKKKNLSLNLKKN